MPSSTNNPSPVQEKLYRIIFEADTPAGKAFDVLLIISIKVSVLVVMLDSVRAIRQDYGTLLNGLKMEHETLTHGDLIKVGPWELRTEFADENGPK